MAENNAVHADPNKRCTRIKRADERLIGVSAKANPLAKKKEEQLRTRESPEPAEPI